MGFAEQLRKARNTAGYTQQQVADAMGITNSTYCGYETGKRQPDVEKIKRLASILNTTGDYLLETDQLTRSDGRKFMSLYLRHKKMLNDFCDLSEHDQSVVEKLIFLLAEKSDD